MWMKLPTQPPGLACVTPLPTITTCDHDDTRASTDRNVILLAQGREDRLDARR
jgi:hypothetical protein